jgi:hypothetical protein
MPAYLSLVYPGRTIVDSPSGGEVEAPPEPVPAYDDDGRTLVEKLISDERNPLIR